MRVSGFQFPILWEDPDANFNLVTSLAENAVLHNIDLIVLPEMFATGFSMNVKKTSSFANKIDSYLKNIAYDFQLYVVGGFADVSPNNSSRYVNVSSAYTPDGICLERYYKIHPFSYGEENKYFDGGSHLVTWKMKDFRVSPFICYDLRFPEIFRINPNLTDLIVVTASWPSVRSFAWRHLLIARAIENQSYVLGVNRTGEGGGLDYSGDSCLINPDGSIVSTSSELTTIVHSDISLEYLIELRERFPFLKDRKKDLYASLGVIS